MEGLERFVVEHLARFARTGTFSAEALAKILLVEEQLVFELDELLEFFGHVNGNFQVLNFILKNLFDFGISFVNINKTKMIFKYFYFLDFGEYKNYKNLIKFKMKIFILLTAFIATTFCNFYGNKFSSTKKPPNNFKAIPKLPKVQKVNCNPYISSHLIPPSYFNQGSISHERLVTGTHG